MNDLYTILQIASINADDIWPAEVKERDRSLWNAKIFPITPIPGSRTIDSVIKTNNINFRDEIDELFMTEEIIPEENNYFHLFFFQYLSSYSKGKLHSSVFDAITIWKKSKKMSLSDLLKYGDGRAMHDWRNYLINIQQNSNTDIPNLPNPKNNLPNPKNNLPNPKNNLPNPKANILPLDRTVGVINCHEVKEKRSEILNSIAVSRRQLGNYYQSPPTSLELFRKLDSMYLESNFAIKSIYFLFQNCEKNLPKGTGSGSIGTSHPLYD